MVLSRTFLTKLCRRHFQTLVSTQWLSEHLSECTIDDNKIRILHASWDNCEDYKKGHVQNSLCFDGLQCRDIDSKYKNMLPSEEKFADFVSQLGISNDTHVIVYDASSKFPSLDVACRVWFMFKVFGHQQCSVLDGGLFVWEKKEKRPVIQGEQTNKPKPSKFIAKFKPEMVVSYEEVFKNQQNNFNQFKLIDSRYHQRFIATKTTMKEDIPGHIKGAINFPMPRLLDPKSRLLRDWEHLKQEFNAVGLNFNEPMVASCGTGLVGSATVFAAHRCGVDIPLYDGSWYEYVRRAPDDCTICTEVGEPE